MANVALAVEGLVKRYSSDVVVGPISFEVREGEFFSLLGPSGCGKTTTLRCIAGFEALSEGAIRLMGARLDDRPPHKRDVGLVFQNYALFPHLTVFENVAFGLRLRKRSKAEIAERVGRILDLVGMADLVARYPAQISGGQQQRVAIARSLVLEPPLLLFDEPLSNLDFKLRMQMRWELRNLQQRLGKTSIYVTHDQSEALALSDRIAVLSQGRIEQIGTPREIYEMPASAFVADFIGSSNILEATVTRDAGDAAEIATTGGLALRLSGGGRAGGAALKVLVRPERIRLLANGEPGGFEAAIEDLTYLGEDTHLRTVAASGERLLVTLKSGAATRPLARGARVRLAIGPDDLHELRR